MARKKKMKRWSTGSHRIKMAMVSMLVALSLMSCDGASSGVRCMNEVQKAYPNDTVISLPSSRFRFIVTQSCGSIIYVETLNLTNAEISASAILRPCDVNMSVEK